MKLKNILAATCMLTTCIAGAQNAERQFAIDNYKRYYNIERSAADSSKYAAIEQLRQYYHQNPYKLKVETDRSLAGKYLDLLTEGGTFSDMDATEKDFEKNNTYQKSFSDTNEDVVGIFIRKAYERIFQIVSGYRMGNIGQDQLLSDKVLKAILHYGELEINRPNDKPRFHASCFAIPTAAVNIYFAFVAEMDQAERGNSTPLMTEAADMLKTVALEAWTQPLRRDETDKNVVSTDRFRNHVWWVGGNALGYRSLLPIAAMYRSVPMIDVLAEVCKRAISPTSQTTYHESFWTEGFTADGAGWGHGKQCLVWGYPIDGASSAMNMLNMLNGTPWADQLSKENVAALMNFFRGGNWYYYKGYRLPGLDRNSYKYNPAEKSIPYAKMLDNVVKNWIGSFSAEEQQELLELQKEVKNNRISMKGYPAGQYSGVRWFFNNDDLMKKTDNCHININMASYRTDGLESAAYADSYNFYPTDGATLFQRTGDEYFRVMGGWDVTAMPGVTAREGMDRLTPVTNWRGYCSKHNMAAGTTDRNEYGVAGWIFEKMNGANKEGVNDKGQIKVENELLYGFKAYKSYFIMKDYFVALGAGITNMQPEIAGEIRTTIDQTALVDKVTIQDKKGTKVLDMGQHKLKSNKKQPVWLTQKGKFSYALLPQYTQEASVWLETKPTDWTARNFGNRKIKELPEEVKILRICASHGQAPKNDKYGYVVYTGNGTPASKLPFQVLRNDTLVQAIRLSQPAITQAVFYDAKEILKTKDTTVSVSAPCAVMIKQSGKRLSIYVTDATMNPELKEIIVTVNGTAHHVQLPHELLCGDTASLEVEI